jgi:tRNA A37 threonylcarbamoyladenosine modification protein TsaB
MLVQYCRGIGGLLSITDIPVVAVQSLRTCADGIGGLLSITDIPVVAVQSLFICAAGIEGLLVRLL